jgi:hypothetical protein
LVLPDTGSGGDTAVTLALAQTLTNKTLTSPTINSVSVTGNVMQGDVTTQTISAVFTGAFTSGSVTISYKIINGVVHVRVLGVTGTSSSASQLTAGTGLPVGYRPTVGLYFPAMVQTGGSTYVCGVVTINTSGIIVFWNVGITGFPGSGTVGWLDQTFSFPVY